MAVLSVDLKPPALRALRYAARHWVILSAALLLLVLGCVGWGLRPAFDEVVIESHPVGGGMAHKTVTWSGRMTGAHSGSTPGGGVIIHQEEGRMKFTDLVALKRLTARLTDAPYHGTPKPDPQGYSTVIVRYLNGNEVRFHSRWSDPGFGNPDAEEICRLVGGYRVGAW